MRLVRAQCRAEPTTMPRLPTSMNALEVSAAVDHPESNIVRQRTGRRQSHSGMKWTIQSASSVCLMGKVKLALPSSRQQEPVNPAKLGLPTPTRTSVFERRVEMLGQGAITEEWCGVHVPMPAWRGTSYRIGQ